MERSGTKQSQQYREIWRLLPCGRNDNCLTGLDISRGKDLAAGLGRCFGQ